MRICAGASAGGHTAELMALLGSMRDTPHRPVVYVTTLEILRADYEAFGPTHVIGECDRNAPLRMLAVAGRAFRVAWRERPDVLVTTGSLPLAILALWVKLFRGRVVWIDSVAQIEDLSWSGKLARRIADLTLAQWPSVADRYPDVEYAGQLV